MTVFSPYDIKKDFTHLHVHSRFSVRDALPSPSALVQQAQKLGFDSLAITDHGNMGSHYQFASAAKKAGIKPIFGIEAYLCDDISIKESINVENADGSTRKRRPKHYHVILLAKTTQGYENLKTMSYISAVQGFYYEPRIDWNLLSQHSEGLICSSACLAGEIASSILNEAEEQVTLDIIDRYKQLFKDDFYLEAQWHQMDDEKIAYSNIMRLAKSLNIPIIATNDVHYTVQNDAIIHDQVVAMKFKRDEDKGGSSDTRNLTSAYKKPEFFLKSADEMFKSFSDNPEALYNTREIVDKIEYQYPVDHPIIWPKYNLHIEDTLIEWQKKHFPYLSLSQAFLLKKSMDGLKELGLSDKKEYRERLRYEWDVIFDLGYEQYFITQWIIAEECKERDITMGPGRGSGAGSLALYTLGITKIDPLKLGLIFERFLNPGRGPGFDHKLPIMVEEPIKEEKPIEEKISQPETEELSWAVDPLVDTVDSKTARTRIEI